MSKHSPSLTKPELREHIVRARVSGEVSTDVYIAALEALTDILGACAEAKSYYDDGTDDALDVAAVVRKSIEEAKKAEDDAKEAEQSAKDEAKQARKEADERCKEMDLECRALRKRAEEAEAKMLDRSSIPTTPPIKVRKAKKAK